MSNPFDAFDSPAPAPRAPRARSRIDPDAIARGAAELGIDPVDLATAISYETAGTFDPDKAGPTTKWGQHRGLIQFGEPQRAKYGVRPGMTMAEQMPAVVAYLRDTGVKPGMGLLDVYSAINAGGVGRHNASDAAAGGAPGTVADKVRNQMGDHRRKAQQIMGFGGEGGGGGGGSFPATAANPFDQFDQAPGVAEALAGPNPFDQFDAPDFSNVQTAVGSTEAMRGMPALPSEVLPSGNGDIPLRPQDREVGHIYTDKRGVPRRWLGDGWASGEQARETTIMEALGGMGLAGVQGMTRVPETLLDLVGWATGGESLLTQGGKAKFEESRKWLEGFKPEAYRAEKGVDVVETDEQGRITGVNMPSAEKVLDVIGESGAQIPAMVYGGGGLRNAAQAVLPNAPRLASVLGYGTANAGMVAPGIAEQARTEALQAGATPEQAQEAANKAMAMAVPLTMATGGVGEGLAGVQGSGARSLISAMLRGAATEAPAEAVEEAGTSAIGDIAQGRDVNQANALESAIMAAFGGGLPGAAVAGTEYMGNRNRPADLPADPVNIADIIQQAQTILPAVAAEGQASPRQDAAPAAPPTSPQAEQAPQEVQALPEPAGDAGAARPDMAAATRSIDDRLAALDEAAAAQIDEAEVSALNAERQELDDLVREQDRARREGIVQPLEARLSPEERATADARRQEIAATLERHRAARTAADQAQRLRSRLEAADTDAALYEVAREINPTLGTRQAESFRAAPAQAPGAVPGPRAVQAAPGPDSVPGPSAPATPSVSAPVGLGTGQNAQNVADIPSRPPANVSEQQRAPAASAPPAAPRRAPATPEAPGPAPEVAQAAPEGPRAEAQRQPAAEPVPGHTSLKNAVTDAERIAEGRDPIIREARKANRETVDEAVRAVRETPSIGRETALRLAEGGPVELKDEAILLVHKVDLRKRRDAAAERAQDPNASEEARAIARREYDDAVQQIDEVDMAARRVGTESGRLLQLRKRMIAEDYSLPALERKLQMVVNRELKPAERAELAELADKVATLQRKLDAVESQQASAQVAEMLSRLMKQAPGRGATLAQRRTAAAESKAALSAMAGVRAPQRSIPADDKAPGPRSMRAWEFGRDLRQRNGGETPGYAFYGSELSRDELNKLAAIEDGNPVVRAFFESAIRGAQMPRRAIGQRYGAPPNEGVSRNHVEGSQELGVSMASVEGTEYQWAPMGGRAGTKPATYSGWLLDPNEFWGSDGEPLMVGLSPVDSQSKRSIAPAPGEPGQARAALAERLGRGVVARLERAGVLEFDDRSGGTWDGVRIGIGNVAPENALGVLLHEVSHANMLDVLGEQGYERALRDLDALEASGDRIALRATRRAAKSGETGQRLDDERIAYMVEEATNAQKQAGTLPARVTDFLRGVVSAFRRWAATSAVFRALERAGINRPTLRPDDFVAFARRGLDRMVADSRDTVSSGLRKKVSGLERDLRTSYLTGLPNRRKFDEDAALGWPTVAFFDVDTFKKLNDAVGHDTADVVLKAIGDEVSKLASDTVRPYHASGDEFLFRFKSAADARPVMDALQQALEDVVVELEATTADGESKFYEYQGIGISYGVGKNYDQADADAKRQKDARLAAGIREEPRTNGPSRRLRESAPRPGGRRAGDPQAVGAQRSVTDQTQTPAFKRWFGKSQVVDENGEPLVVYHGTNDRITTFDPKKSGGMFWFSENRDKIAAGESGAVGTSRIMPVYLKAEKLAGWDEYESLTTDQLIAQGFDGVKLDDDYIVFEPEQIKSATSNRGTFDPTDPNIMRSIPEGEADVGAPVPAGADPVAFFHLAQLGAFHYADGAQDIGEWTRRMEADLGAAAGRFRGMLPDAFKAAKAQASKPVRGQETVAEAVEAIGDQRRPRDVKRVVRAVVSEGMRGEDAILAEAARVLDMEEADVRSLFVQSESKARTLTEAQAELQELRRQLRAAQRPDPETRYQEQRARDFQRRIAELEERIAAGDFAKRERTEHDLIEKNKRLQFELEKTKERFHRYALEAEFQSRTPVGKVFGETVAGINFARAIMTSLDLSAILRQGGKISFGHPLRALKAVPGSLKAFVSEDADFRIRQKIENRPNGPLYKKYGLELTSIGGDALSRTEEAYASRWVDKLPGFAGGGLIRGSGRSYTAFLNRLRADSFDAMLAALARDGSNPTKEEGKAIANYVNVATGRGKVGKNEKSGEVLNTVFFAPRLVASRFQLLAGQPLYGGSNRTRRMIAAEYARFLMGVSVAIGLAMLMRDEDDETKPIELDPRSANFGKVRFGDETFLDPLAGLAQVTVFLARVASGETRTTTTDTLRPLRDSYRLSDIAPGLGDGHELDKVGYGGRDIPDVIASFLRSKLAPVPGAIINVATGKNMIGEEVTPLSAAGELVTPMSVGNLVDVMEAQGMARGTAINLLGILGMSVQYRKSEEEEAAEDANGIPGALGFGTAEDLQ